MMEAIIAKLKTGSISAVVSFGTDKLPQSPYVVVKTERDPLCNGRIYRVIAHARPNQGAFLEEYIFNEVLGLLDRALLTNRFGDQFLVYASGDWSDIIIENDDGTIAMERTFLVPSRW